MSQFDNLYLCPRCEHTDLLHAEDMICDKCGFKHCFVAKHISSSDRRYWVDLELNGDAWRKEKRVATMVKQHLPKDKNITKSFEKLVSQMFATLSTNKDQIDSYFPEFTRDYKRTTGKRNKGWKSSKPNLRQGRAATRGLLYEGAFNRILSEHDQFQPVFTPAIMLEDATLWEELKSNGDDLSEEHLEQAYDETELIYFEPDGWFLHEGQKIPIEFKTYGEGGLVRKNFLKGFSQSRRYASLSNTYHGENPNHYSALIICCPEERKFACLMLDDRIEKVLGS